MRIREATTDYERWLRRHTPVVVSALREKHERMREDPFGFLRGTFYRWAQLYPALAAEPPDTPHVVAIGDLHVDSFGTWRDAEGRLAWGVDDFDDAYPLPYTSDLVRLATSVSIAHDLGVIETKLSDACAAILDGYELTIRQGGRPIVLAEAHEHFEKLGINRLKPARRFWRTLDKCPSANGALPRSALRSLTAALPAPLGNYRVLRRRAGLGSLGQPRFVLVAEDAGGEVAREVKALVPSSCVWAAGGSGREQPYYTRAMSHAIRSPDPYQRVIGRWIVRRLSPDSNPIMMASLDGKHDELRLLHAMGIETANIHLGTRRQMNAVLADLSRRPRRWLRRTAKVMARAVERDWKDYRT
jgi:Uncharacterized protein conserved in bacteria (DUF2252)